MVEIVENFIEIRILYNKLLKKLSLSSQLKMTSKRTYHTTIKFIEYI